MPLEHMGRPDWIVMGGRADPGRHDPAFIVFGSNQLDDSELRVERAFTYGNYGVASQVVRSTLLVACRDYTMLAGPSYQDCLRALFGRTGAQV